MALYHHRTRAEASRPRTFDLPVVAPLRIVDGLAVVDALRVADGLKVVDSLKMLNSLGDRVWAGASLGVEA